MLNNLAGLEFLKDETITNYYNEDTEEYAEVCEWWVVSSWLCDKLKEHGQVVITSENIWGRCTSGQAIFLDSVISDICKELGMLEG